MKASNRMLGSFALATDVNEHNMQAMGFDGLHKK
jgi:hypothetical protein